MKLMLRNVRIAFPTLFEPKTVNGEGEPRFSATFIIPKNHPQIAEVNKVIDSVAAEKWKDKATAKIKQARVKDRVCLHDGDLKAEYEGFTSHYYISANNKTRPLVLDSDKSPLIAADGKPYAGCYVNAQIDIWAQDNTYGVGINASLSGVQFYKDGDAFSGSAPANPDDFDDLSTDAESLV